MIACPLCGDETRVTETRSYDQYTRRRRECTRADCRGRVTTAEIVIALDDGRHKPLGDVILMPRRDVDELLEKLCAALAVRYGSATVLEMVTAALPDTTAKGTSNGTGNDHGTEQRD